MNATFFLLILRENPIKMSVVPLTNRTRAVYLSIKNRGSIFFLDATPFPFLNLFFKACSILHLSLMREESADMAEIQ